MKILMIHPQMSLNESTEIAVAQIARTLMKRGHDVDVLTLSEPSCNGFGDLNLLRIPKGDYLTRRIPDGLRGLPGSFKRLFLLGYLVNDLAPEYDVINPQGFPSLWTVPLYNKTVWTCNELPFDRRGRFNPGVTVSKLFDSFIVSVKKPWAIVPDVKSAKRCAQHYGLHPIIIQQGVEPLDGSEKPVPITNRFDILCPTDIAPEGNQLKLLEAALTLETTLTRVRVILTGYKKSETYFNKLLKYAQRNNLILEYIDCKTREDLGNVSSSSHAAVFAGKDRNTAFTPFEHISAGTPTVVFHKLDCSSTVRNCNLGLVTDNLTNALGTVYYNYNAFQEASKVRSDYVRQAMSWDAYCDQFETLLLKRIKS